MAKLLCPDCGHDVVGHDEFPNCYECELSEKTALRKAQRAAAIAHLRALGKSCLGYKRLKMDWHAQNAAAKIYIAIAAYRAVGILPTKERKP